MIKNIYKQRIKTLNNDYNKLKSNVLSEKKIVDEYLELIADVLQDIDSITESNKIEPNMKYIEIDKKSKYIETISLKITDIQKSIQIEFDKLNKEKKILIESCVEEHKNLQREDVLIEIDRIFNEK